MNKTQQDKDFTDITKATYKKLNAVYRESARMIYIYELLKVAYDIEDYTVFDPKMCNNGILESWLLDRQADWLSGKPVDFRKVYEVIIKSGDFTETEKRLFELGHIEERLWAVFLAVCDPGNTNNI